MQGAPKRHVNAEEMLAELKQALESSTRAPNAARPSASTAPKSSSPGRETRRSQMDGESDRPVRAKANSPVGQPNDLQKSTQPSSRRWTLTAGAIALTVAATIGVSFALMNKAPDSAEREPSVTATESLAKPQNEQTLKPSSDSRLLMEESQKLAPSQAGNLEPRPEGGTAPANSGLALAGGNGELDASHLASFGLESAPPAFTPVPPSTPAILAPSQVIRPDGTPIATAPSTPASTASAPPLAQTPKPAVPSSAPQMVKPDKGPIAVPPPPPASTVSAPPLAETPKPAGPSAAPQMLKSSAAPIATAPPTPASTASAPPPAETPKPKATLTASASNESAEPSTPKIDSRKKPPEKPSLQKPRKSAKASAKSVAQVEPPTKLAPPKEAETPPHPAQDAGNPTAVAPVAKTSVQQRVADGMTHAFGYLIHLPGALVPHFGGTNPDAH
jgi:hypothetical protein